MGGIMRILLIGLVATLLALPLSATVRACEDYDAAAQASTVDLSAVEKKDETTKPKKTVVKKKKEKVEYMRAAPMPPGAK
jgi:hypothetical protein